MKKMFGRGLLGRMIVLAVMGIAVACALPAMADVGTQDLATTNKFAGSTTTTANMGNGFFLEKQADVGLCCKFQGDAAGTANAVLCIARSVDGTTYETTPCINWVIPMNGNTAVVAYTNFNRDLIGPAGWIKVTQCANTNSANLTNCSVTAIVKTIKAAP